jgi:hypothetical protein
MSIAVLAGGRWLDFHRVTQGGEWWPQFNAVRAQYDITELWHGACSSNDPRAGFLRGGDAIGDRWAKSHGVTVRMFPAPWRLYEQAGLDPKRAGPRRVRDMFRGESWYILTHSEQDLNVGTGPDRLIITTEALPMDQRPTLCILLPGGPGTRRTGKEAEGLGIPVVQVPMAYREGVPRVINANHEDGFCGDVVYIGRGWKGFPCSPLHNPYTLREHGSKAFDLYRRHLWAKVQARDSAVMGALKSIGPESRLVCWCKDENGYGRCHGDIVVKAWEYLREQV